MGSKVAKDAEALGKKGEAKLKKKMKKLSKKNDKILAKDIKKRQKEEKKVAKKLAMALKVLSPEFVKEKLEYAISVLKRVLKEDSILKPLINLNKLKFEDDLTVSINDGAYILSFYSTVNKVRTESGKKEIIHGTEYRIRRFVKCGDITHIENVAIDDYVYGLIHQFFAVSFINRLDCAVDSAEEEEEIINSKVEVDGACSGCGSTVENIDPKNPETSVCSTCE